LEAQKITRTMIRYIYGPRCEQITNSHEKHP
jgi:hypothetical protein